MTTGFFNYVYSTDNTKVYIDGDNFFTLDHDGTVVPINELTQSTYKKCTIPKKVGSKWDRIEIYNCLNDGKWYRKEDDNKEFSSSNCIEIPDVSISNYLGSYASKQYDYSAINYCVESYIFSMWVQTELKDIEDGIFIFNNNNDPEKEDSLFAQAKREVIKETLIRNLSQAITSYSSNSEGEYQLPVISETDWDQILSNVSIVTFVQNIPIGMKYYNNYAIATSTVNKEYVDPNEIYLNADGDTYYHKIYCDKLSGSNIIGYRNIDYIAKSYETTETDSEGNRKTITKYYYAHGAMSGEGNIQSGEACYYCLVQRDLYKIADGGLLTSEEKAYNTALARERYIAKTIKLPGEVESSYFINIKPVDENNNELDWATYSINGRPGEGTKSYPMSKEINQYEIRPSEGMNTSTDLAGKISDLGSYDSPNETTTGEPTTYSAYTADFDQVTINNIKYSNTEMTFNVIGIETWGADYRGENFDNKEKSLSTDYGNGYINIKLPYKSTYTKNNENLTVTANINDFNSITLATTLEGITGKVRLKFTNEDSRNEDNSSKDYYSSNIFEITSDNNTIYCKIPENTAWYQKEWAVEVQSIDGNRLAYGTVDYYTINDAPGLIGFANAVNGTKGPEAGARTAGRTFKLIENITDVGTMAPIAGLKKDNNNDGWNDIWFNGIFEGQGHTVSDITVKTEDVSDRNNRYNYNSFGLFGWVGTPAKIEDLVISNINVDLSSTDKVDYKAGGLAGFCDVGESINNVTVTNSNIKGTSYVGGIIGESKKQITNSSIIDTKVSSVGAKNIIFENNEIYVGGIVGKSENEINTCKVLSSTIGEGNIVIDSTWTYKKDQYYVGGIAGYTNSIVKAPELSDNVSVIGGAITNVATDKFKATYTGGVIGYKDTDQKIENSFNVNCTVSGHDNVGGIVGFNAKGDIENVTFGGTISADGINIGGIVGCNIGGKISNCTNNVNINVTGETVTGKNVGGIVGCNSNQNIEECYNNAPVTGKQNVGGIVGITYNGEINSCGNNKDATVKGIGNTLTSDITEDKDTESYLQNLFQEVIDKILNSEPADLLYLYNVHGNNATGTGGITGKNYCATIMCSYNNATIITNYNGGGIEGLNFNGTTKYSYNSGKVTNIENNISQNDKSMNRLGGICGAGHGVTITSCYNIGEINGIKTGALPLRSGIGGIAGFIVDNVTSFKLEEDEIGIPGYEIPIQYIGVTTAQNEISYCYSAGKLIGGNNSYNNAIVGCVGVGVTFDKNSPTIIQFIENYYLTTITPEGRGARGSLPYLTTKMDNQNGYIGKDENDFKEQLYTWANTLKVSEKENSAIANKDLYNTIAPLEEDKGYNGYGVLWWQLELEDEDYVRLTTNMFLCIISKEGGIEEKNYTGISIAYNPSVNLNGKSLVFREVPFDCEIIDPFPDNKPVECSSCLRWIMMVKDIDYIVEGKTDYTNDSEFWVNNEFKGKITKLSISRGEDKVISIAPALEIEDGVLETTSISTVWKRENITVKTTLPTSSIKWNTYDKNHDHIDSIKGYFEYDPNDSKETYNDGKKVSITMDKYDELSTTRKQPIYLYAFEYYTRSYNALKVRYDYSGPYSVRDGTQANEIAPNSIVYAGTSGVKAHADKSACNVYIPVENLVDKIGETSARNYKLYTAKLNMEFTVDMSSNYKTRPGSYLAAVITLEKKKAGTENWITVDSFIQNNFSKSTGTDWIAEYYTYIIDLEDEKIDDWSLAEVDYNDELRVNIDLVYTSPTYASYININNVYLDITYGPNI